MFSKEPFRSILHALTEPSQPCNAWTLLSGYYSPVGDVASVFKCLRRTQCPGGEPGTCAEGRDSSSIACNACMAGLHSVGAKCGQASLIEFANDP